MRQPHPQATGVHLSSHTAENLFSLFAGITEQDDKYTYTRRWGMAPLCNSTHSLTSSLTSHQYFSSPHSRSHVPAISSCSFLVAWQSAHLGLCDKRKLRNYSFKIILKWNSIGTRDEGKKSSITFLNLLHREFHFHEPFWVFTTLS